MSVIFNGKDMHLLCYGFNPQAEEVKYIISKGGQLRHKKVPQMFAHLETNHGIFISDIDKAEILKHHSPGKCHVYAAVEKLDIGLSKEEFFERCWKGFDSSRFKVQAQEAIELFAKAGGITSFAHPIEMQKEYDLTFNDIDAITKELCTAGLNAIEVFHSSHGEQEISEYKKIAQKYGLLISAGSDYHGGNKTVRLGQLSRHGVVPKKEEITILSVL